MLASMLSCLWSMMGLVCGRCWIQNTYICQRAWLCLKTKCFTVKLVYRQSFGQINLATLHLNCYKWSPATPLLSSIHCFSHSMIPMITVVSDVTLPNIRLTKWCILVLQPCKDTPCNKGLCLPVSDTSHRCICPEGYTIDSTGGACIKDVCSGTPCDPGLCLPNGTDNYYCTCPEGYESFGSHCNAVRSESTGNKRNIWGIT